MPEPAYRAVLLFGAPGVGKGTQGQRLAERPHFLHLSTGDMFRSLDPQSDLGKEVRGYSERGELVPDELTVRIFHDYVRRLIEDGWFNPQTDTLVLDGIPRNLSQCRILDKEVRVILVVHLICTDMDAMVARMKRRAQLEGRKDDQDENVIRRRFEVYQQATQPVLGYYPCEVLLEVDALGRPEEVGRAIEKGLKLQ